MKFMICVPLNLPENVADDVEQELYKSVFGGESGEMDVEMFIDVHNHPSLQKWANGFGKQTPLILAKGKLNG
jgi:hypothetical protein